MQCHTLPGCSHAKTLSVTVLAARVSEWEKIVLFVGFKPEVTSQYTSRAASFAYAHVFIFGRPSANVYACSYAHVSATPYSMLVFIFLLLMLRQSHCCHKQ